MQFVLKKPPAMDKQSETLTKIGRTSLWKLLKEFDFALEIWGRNVLGAKKISCCEGCKIYYLDETWVNAGHAIQKIWKYTLILIAKQAFIEGLSRGLKNPLDKGKQFIITHIGSETWFVKNALLMFESKNTKDYHEEMNAEIFQNWIACILPPLNSLITA